MNRIDFIRAQVKAAGAELMRLREQQIVSIKNGDPQNIVTDVDVQVHELLVRAINKEFPSEHVYSEEGTSGFSGSGIEWVIDPIDGTANFSRGIPHFAICLGVVGDGVPLAGAVLNPVTSELFSFEKGKGAFLNDEPIHVSAVTELKKSSVFFRAGRKEGFPEWGGQAYTALLKNAWKTAGFGSTALDTCYVAAGRIEASIYGTYSAADVAPALGILLEAGGVAVTKEGNPVTLHADAQTVITANNSTVADSIRELIF